MRSSRTNAHELEFFRCMYSSTECSFFLLYAKSSTSLSFFRLCSSKKLTENASDRREKTRVQTGVQSLMFM